MFSERSVRLMYSTHALQCNSIFAILKGEVRAADGDECPRNVAGTEEGSKHGEFHLDLCNRKNRPGVGDVRCRERWIRWRNLRTPGQRMNGDDDPGSSSLLQGEGA